MLNSIISFEVMLNIVLILLVVCQSVYIALQAQKLKKHECRMAKARAIIEKHEKRDNLIIGEINHKIAA